MKQSLLRLMANPAFDLALSPARGGIGTIWMLHRFERTGTDDEMISVPALRANLQYLRKRGYRLISLMSLVETLREGKTPHRKSIVFTVDDGYADFKEIGLPVFEEFDCPVTLFVTTGAIDRKLWFWWDQVEYIVLHSHLTAMDFQIGAEVRRFRWFTPAEAVAVAVAVGEWLKEVPNDDRIAAIDRLAMQLDVEIPVDAPDAYAIMTWGDVSSLAASGLVDVAPHTVTHPILSRVPHERMVWEIRESYRRLCEQYPATVPLFCYPNGRKRDYPPEVFAELRSAGMLAAVNTYVEYARRFSAPEDVFQISRINMPNDVPHVAQIVTGFERMKWALRGGSPQS